MVARYHKLSFGDEADDEDAMDCDGSRGCERARSDWLRHDGTEARAPAHWRQFLYARVERFRNFRSLPPKLAKLSPPPWTTSR